MVWARPVKDGEFHLPWAARIIERGGSKSKLSDEEGNVTVKFT